jgi:hypothetical protein
MINTAFIERLNATFPAVTNLLFFAQKGGFLHKSGNGLEEPRKHFSR